MKWPLYYLTLLFLLGGCSEQHADNVNEKERAVVVAAGSESEAQVERFDLVTAQRDYQGIELKVLDISERTREGRNALAVMLSAPLNPAEDHQSYLNVSEKGKGVVDGGWILSPSGKTLWFPHTEPNTDYEIAIYPGLKAVNKQALLTTVSANIRTRHLKAVVNFDTRGSFLTAGLGNGLPVTAVNIDEINIDFFRIKRDHINDFLQQIGNHRRYYYNLNRLTSRGDLVYSGRYDLSGAKNTRIKRSIDIRDVDALKEPGIYMAVMLAAGEYQKTQLLWFSVTDLGLHARQYDQQLDVHVSSLKTGKPLPRVKVSLLDAKSSTLNESLTSPDGLVSFKGKDNNARLIIAQSGEHYSVIETRKPALDLSEFDLGQRPQMPVELFVYTPRDLFRPGELIDFNGLLRDSDGRRTLATALNVQLKRPDGSVAKTFKWQPQSLDYYHYAWQVPDNAPVGNWELVVTGALHKPVVFPFKVEEFLPERMKLSFNANDRNPIVVAAADELKIPVLGEYLYGAPAAGNRLSTIVSVKPWRSPVKSLQNYQFGHVNEQGMNQKFNLNDIRLDKAGAGKLSVPSRWKSVRSPLEVTAISSLYESGGRPVSRMYSSLVWPAKALLGIRSSFGDKNPEANSRVSFDLVKATLGGELKVARNLGVQLIREDRQYFWVYDDSRGWHYEWTDKEFAEVTETLSISAGKSASVEYPVSYGNYRLEVRDTENNLTSSLRFYAGYNWYSAWKNAQSGRLAPRPDKVSITFDKEHYKAGDTASVTIVPPEAGEALLMVEGNSPLWMQRLSIPEGGVTVKIPVADNWQQHNLYVTAVVLRKGENKKTITPKRSFGIAHLALDRSDRRLQIDFNVPDKILPEQTLNVEMKVSGQALTNGLSSGVYLTLAAVDVGVLSISQFDTPDPHEGFFGRRRYSIENRDMYDQVIEVSDADKARLRFGGDADLSRGGKEPQSEVQIVSLFSGLVNVDKNGHASVPLNIPDFNGRLRLMALAFSSDRFGKGEQELTVAAPVVTQMAMPRFVALGDKATVALDVNNLSGKAQTLTVSLTGQGPVGLTAKEQTVTLADNEKSTLNYTVEATGYNGQAQFDLTVTGQGIAPINRQWFLGVRPPYPALIEQHSKLLETGEQFTLTSEDIAGMLPGSVEALLSLSPRANMDLQSQLKHLLNYPYGCLEQTSSRAFPLTFATADNQRRFGLQQLDEKERIKMIEKGIDRLASMQLRNGGYGLWSNTSAEEHWLTAFVADFLLSARDMGVEVPAILLDKTMTRLKHYVNRGGRFVGERWSQDSNHYTFAYKAYSAYVLSRVKQAPLGTLRTLFDHKLDWAKSGLSQVQLGIALIRMGDKKRGIKAIDKGLGNLPATRQYYGDYGSPIRDMAMVIYLLMDNDIHSNKAFALSFKLAERLRRQPWLSTQDRNALFLAGIALESYRSDSWQARVVLGAAEQSLNQQNPYRSKLDGSLIQQGLMIQSLHDKPLFVSANISGYGKNKPAVSSEGLSIVRSWYTTDGQPVALGSVSDSASGSVKVGELYIVHLEVSAKERTPDALVVDLLAAGFELENQNLDNAIKLDTFKIDGKDYKQLTRHTAIKHQEYRDDRFVAALDLNTYGAANIFYLVRAVTPGTYKVPSPLVEDMYRPERRGVGDTLDSITIENVSF